MGNSANWLKSFMSHKKSNPDDQGKAVSGKRNSKWRLWRSSSSFDSGVSVKKGQVAASEPSNSTTSEADDVYTAAMATLIRAPPRNFLIVRKEWAAIRIQTAFRGLLARRALRALRALVKLQALVRGRLVRKQAAMTLKCMQALVRAQSQIKAHRVRISMEGKSHHPLKQPQQISKTSDLNQWKKDSFSGPMETHKIDKLCQEIWQMEEAHHLDMSPDSSTSSPLSCKHKKGKPRATAKRVTARPQRRSKFVNDESSSSSSVSSSTTVEGADESDFGRSKPRFMNLTSSKMAKQSPRKVKGYDSTKV